MVLAVNSPSGLFLEPSQDFCCVEFASHRYHYQHLLTVRYLAEHQRSIDEWVEGNFIWSRVCFVAAMSLCIGATVPGATFLSFAGGVLFPQPWSSICAYFGYVFGAALSFTLVKNFFGDFCRRHLRKRSIFLTFERAMKKNALVMLIVSRYTVIFPFWFVDHNYLRAMST